MSIFSNAVDKGKKAVIKHNVKKLANDKLSLNGEHDEIINKLADSAIDKVGVNNIIKAKKVLDALKN